MVDVEAAVDALLATERRNPGVAGEEQRGRKRCQNTETVGPEESAAISLRGVSRAEDILQLVPSTLGAGLGSAKEPRPISPQHVPDKSDGVEADQTCWEIVCAACGKSQKQTQYRSHDVHEFLNERRNIRCQICRRTGRKIGGSKHKCRCTECGVYQALSAFRWSKRGRVDICGSCEPVPCAACAAMMSRENFTKRDIRGYFNFDAKHITCLVCKEQQQHAGRQQRPQECKEKSKRKVRTCTKCGVHQAISALRLTKKNGHVDICGNCELVSCAACAAMLSRASFAAWDIRRYFSFAGARHITCLVCKEQQQHARQRRLQERMKKSKRKVCTCKQPQAHTRTCLLRIRFA